MNVDDFIKENLKNKNGIRLKNYQPEILKILDAGLTVRDVYRYLTQNYAELEKISERHLYEFVRKIKSPKNSELEVGQTKPETEKIAEPVNLQVRGENPETIGQNTETQPQQRRSKSILKPEKLHDDWNLHRKKMGLPNTIDDEWRTKTEEE